MNVELQKKYEIMDIIHSMYTEHILQNLRENNMFSPYRYKIT